MWPFKKKIKPVEEVKPKTKVEVKEEEFNIGMTNVKYTFKDGRQFISRVYGRFYQYHSVYDGTFNAPFITESRIMAQNFISQFSTNLITLVDDSENVKESICGVVIAAEILYSEPYYKKFDVYSVVEVKE